MPTAGATSSCSHANQHEIHRELGTTQHIAWQQALADKRSVLCPVPACPWWPFIWSQRTPWRGDDGKVPVEAPQQAVDAPAPAPSAKPRSLLHCPVF